MSRYLSHLLLVTGVLLGWLAGPPVAVAQPLACFPSCDTTDARFLTLVGTGAETLSGDSIAIHLAFRPDSPGIEFGIFDGETSGMWDFGAVPLSFTLYVDPLADGAGTKVIWQKSGSEMVDNAWFDLSLPHDRGAVAPSGNLFYRLEVVNSAPGVLARSSFKVRSRSLYLRPQAFSFEATLLTNRDFATIYPNGFPGPTTYDGNWRFFVDVPGSTSFLRSFDGDLDHGTQTCSDRDTDDPDTPNHVVPHFAMGTAAMPEGVAVGVPSKSDLCPLALVGGTLGRWTTASPPDDFTRAVFVRSPSIVYEFRDPILDGYANPNPSGNREWEQFLIGTGPDCVEGINADHCLRGEVQVGVWTARVKGVDLSNLNAWRFDYNVVGEDPDGDPLRPPRVYLIGDTVWRDSNANRIQDRGEPGIPGVVMELLAGNQIVGRTLTDADGLYLFEVDPGTHTVRVAARNFTAPSPGGALGDRVWLDLDGNGLDDGEPGIPNVEVRLIDAGPDGRPGGGNDSLVAVKRTDADGNYLFGDLPPGTYYARLNEVTVTAGLEQSADPDEPGVPCAVCDATSAPVTITGTETYLHLDFGYANATPLATALVGDFLWHDLDGDGIQDGGEPGILGVTVALVSLGGDGLPGGGDDMVVDTTATVGGYYLFTGVAPGSYEVRVTDSAGLLAGYSPTSGPESNPNPTAPFAVSGGDAILTKDFGYVNDGLFGVRDVVWFDANRNGLLDGGESGIGGVTVKILGRFGNVLASTITDAGGNFSFTGLPSSTYRLVVTDFAGELDGLLPTTRGALAGFQGVTIDGADVAGSSFGYVDVAALIGLEATTVSPSRTDTVTAANILTYDYGYRGTGAIGDTVFVDNDKDGVFEPLLGELGVDGVKVRLLADLNGDGVTDFELTRTTSGGGQYLFENLTPGVYRVVVLEENFRTGGALARYFQVSDPDGALDNRTRHSLAPGEKYLLADFGYLLIRPPGTGTPGYWKNHAEAWPVNQIVMGGITFSKAQAIKILAHKDNKKDDKDKELTLARALISAKLNAMVGNDTSCINSDGTLAAADAWMGLYPPGANLRASSPAWKVGEPLSLRLDAYNNGLLCAPHRG